MYTVHWYKNCWLINIISLIDLSSQIHYPKALKHHNKSQTTTNFDFEHEQTSSWLKHLQKYIFTSFKSYTLGCSKPSFFSLSSLLATSWGFGLRTRYLILRTYHILMYVIGTTELALIENGIPRKTSYMHMKTNVYFVHFCITFFVHGHTIWVWTVSLIWYYYFISIEWNIMLLSFISIENS